jgi:hypothetical protein
MTQPIATYQSYLVRLWQSNSHAAWHASARSVQTGEIVHFADLDALFVFLWREVTPHPSPSLLSEGAVEWTDDVSSPVQPQFPSEAGEG